MSDAPRTDAFGSPPPPNIELLVATLARHDVDYALIGGMAAVVHGASTPTEDLDILARGGLENLTRLAHALHELHADRGRPAIDADDLRGVNTRWITAAGRLDVLLTATGAQHRITYNEVAARLDHVYVRSGLIIPIVSLPDLIMLKAAAGRPKDVAAVEELRRLYREQTATGGVVEFTAVRSDDRCDGRYR